MRIAASQVRECPGHGAYAAKVCPLCPPQQASAAPVRPVVTPEAAKGAETAEARFTVFGEPIGKPRMTQRDKWQKRPCVVKYRAWADRARAAAGAIPKDAGQVRIKAYFAIPESWSAKKQSAAVSKPHRQRPDVDNVAKAAMDALLPEDCAIHALHAAKFWDDGLGPRIEIIITKTP